MRRSNDRGRGLVKVAALLVARTEEEELPCEDVFALLDEYAELVARGEDVTHLMLLVRRHLELCRDCCEEYEALERILHNLPG